MKQYLNLKIAGPATVALAAVVWPVAAVADCGVPTGTKGLDQICQNNGNPIYNLLGGIVNWAIGLIGGLAVLAIIISGIQYVTSQGNPDGVKKAKSRLVNAVVGLVLLALIRVILGALNIVQ